MGNAAPTSAEVAAREFMEVEGLGEVTAMVLATTASLGGQPHPSLASLTQWAQASKQNAALLQNFLLHR